MYCSYVPEIYKLFVIESVQIIGSQRTVTLTVLLLHLCDTEHLSNKCVMHHELTILI